MARALNRRRITSLYPESTSRNSAFSEPLLGWIASNGVGFTQSIRKLWLAVGRGLDCDGWTETAAYGSPLRRNYRPSKFLVRPAVT
jgi:hypothetical protein